MVPKYEKGQRVTIVQAKNHRSSARDSDLNPYLGQSGEITDFYWVNVGLGVPRAFYIYTVQIGENDVVMHEDELEPFIE